MACWLSSLPGFSSWPQAKRRDVPGHSGATPSAQIHLFLGLQTSAIFGLPAGVRTWKETMSREGKRHLWDVFGCVTWTAGDVGNFSEPQLDMGSPGVYITFLDLNV